MHFSGQGKKLRSDEWGWGDAAEEQWGNFTNM